MRRATRTAGLMAGLVTVALLVVPAVQAGAAKGGPPAEEGLGNNLSVPTYFVPSTEGAPALRTTCPTDAVDPTGAEPVYYNDIAYYLQKTEAVWSAECSDLDMVSVTAQWGANLTNDRAIKAGKPIRVEMALLSGDTGTGFSVVNLTPDLPDRNSTYGTRGVQDWFDYMVWSAGATLTIQQVEGAQIYSGPFTAEINSTGKVVYGYNWGIKGKTSAPTPGTYELTFWVPAGTTITGNVDDGVVNTTNTAQTSTVTINVAAGGRTK